ncbi:MAG: hypothetical protein JJ974_02300 [Phycisphaerales bacterium]|nr:hypothetical protein [Phycisphaerales bacterium]
MSKAIHLAKYTFAFIIIAGGFSLIIGSLMGGGLSSSSKSRGGFNNDPRSVLVQTVLLETDASIPRPVSLPLPGSTMANTEFQELMSETESFRSIDNAHIRTPTMLVQHRETGHLMIEIGNSKFDASVSPSVIDTKNGPVLRVGIEILRSDKISGQTPRMLAFETAYTAAPGSAIVLDLADLGQPGTRSVLALRTTLIDPTPPND